MRDAIAVAPVARSGSSGRSDFSMNLPTPGMFTRKPGLAPLSLPLSMVQLPSGMFGSSGGPSQPPRTTAAASSVLKPRRFWNQLELATSSNALALVARPAGSTAKKRATGRKIVWFSASQAHGDTYSSGAGVNGFSSSSCVTGARK